MTATITRHRWTKAELAHLNRTVGASKSKGAAFEKIAKEMKLTKGAVAGTYYNHHKNAAKKADVKAPSAPRKTIKQAMPTKSKDSGAWYAAFQQGRPYEFQSLSENELLDVAQGIRAEVARRQDVMSEIGSFFKG